MMKLQEIYKHESFLKWEHKTVKLECHENDWMFQNRKLPKGWKLEVKVSDFNKDYNIVK